MSLIMKHEKHDGYEEILNFSDDTGLQGYVAIHNTKLGMGLGGCRIKSYSSNEEALLDALRLAKGMTYKSSLAGLNFGGAKCVVNAPKATREIMLKVGEAVEFLKGRYCSAEDVGTTLDDVHIMREVTKHTAQLDGSMMTARGVLACIKAAVKYRNQWEDLEDPVDLENLTVWIQGLGKVGMDLFNRLVPLKTDLYVSDLRPDAVVEAIESGAREITEEQKRFINIYAPCAMGQVINENNVNKIAYAIICGSANNQLVHEEYADVLRHNDVLYCPDWLVNSGGVINAAYEIGIAFDEEACGKATDAVGDKLLEVFAMADEENTTPLKIASIIAETRFNGSPL